MAIERKELLDISAISFGHMMRRDAFQEELKPILDKWKREENLFVDRASKLGKITILLKCYDATVELMEVNKVIEYIEEELGEKCSSGNDFEDNDTLKDFFNITLIKL